MRHAAIVRAGREHALTEQHRIVVKVDELMTLCDALEADLTTTAATRSRLLEATLQEALSGPHAKP